MCGNIILSGICANNFSRWSCSLKNESSSISSSSSGYGSSSSSSYSSGSGSGSSSDSSSASSSIHDSNSNSDPNPNPNPNLNSKPNPNPNPNLNSNLNPNPNLNLKPNPEVFIRSCNQCNYIKLLTDFDESKYTCGRCSLTKVNCLYCPPVVRYDGIRAHVKKQHTDVDYLENLLEN